MGRNAVIYTIAYTLSGAIGFTTLSALTHFLAPPEYSVYSTATNFAFFAGSALFAWVRFSAGRFEAEAIGNIAFRFWLLNFAAMAMVASALFAIGILTDSVSVPTALSVLLLTVSQSLFDLSQEFRRARAQVRAFTAYNLLRSVMALGAGAVLAYVFAVGVLVVVSLAVAFLVAALLNLWRIAAGQKGGQVRTYELRPIVAYGAGIAVSGLVFSSIGVVSRLMVVHLVGAEASGTYNASIDLAGQISGIVAQSVASVIAPSIFKSYAKGDMREVVDDFNKGGELLLAALVPTTVGLLLVNRPMVELLTGTAFHDTLIQLLPWAVLATAFTNFTHFYLQIAFQMTNRPMFQILSGVLHFVLLVGFSYALIRFNGVLGGVQALVLTSVLTMLATFILARRTFPIPIPWKALTKIGLSAFVMTAVVQTLPTMPVAAELAVKSLLGGVVYVSMAFALDICGIRVTGLGIFRRITR